MFSLIYCNIKNFIKFLVLLGSYFKFLFDNTIKKTKLFYFKNRFAYSLILSSLMYLYLIKTIDNPRTHWFDWLTNHVLYFYCFYSLAIWPHLIKKLLHFHKKTKKTDHCLWNGLPKKVPLRKKRIEIMENLEKTKNINKMVYNLHLVLRKKTFSKFKLLQFLLKRIKFIKVTKRFLKNFKY